MAPSPIPFWEQARGGGPVTKWHAARQSALDKEQDEKLRLLDPRLARSMDIVRRKQSGAKALTYRQRREQGLCTVCLRQSTAARCDICWARYYEQPCRVKLRKG